MRDEAMRWCENTRRALRWRRYSLARAVVDRLAPWVRREERALISDWPRDKDGGLIEQ